MGVLLVGWEKAMSAKSKTDRSPIRARILAGLTAALVAPALAQTRSAAPGPDRNQVGVPAAAPGPVNLSGTPAEAPRPLPGINQPPISFAAPLSGLGGVRAEGSRPIPLNQPAPQPAFRPMRVGPFPGIVNTPTVPSGGRGGRPAV